MITFVRKSFTLRFLPGHVGHETAGVSLWPDRGYNVLPPLAVGAYAQHNAGKQEFHHQKQNNDNSQGDQHDCCNRELFWPGGGVSNRKGVNIADCCGFCRICFRRYPCVFSRCTRGWSWNRAAVTVVGNTVKNTLCSFFCFVFTLGWCGPGGSCRFDHSRAHSVYQVFPRGRDTLFCSSPAFQRAQSNVWVGDWNKTRKGRNSYFFNLEIKIVPILCSHSLDISMSTCFINTRCSEDWRDSS